MASQKDFQVFNRAYLPDELHPIPGLRPLLLLHLHLLVLLEHTLQLDLKVPHRLLGYVGTASQELVLEQGRHVKLLSED